MTTSVSREDLVKFLEATGHPPRIERVVRASRPRPTETIAFAGRMPI